MQYEIRNTDVIQEKTFLDIYTIIDNLLSMSDP